MKTAKTIWGNVDGKEVFLLNIENDKNLSISITNYGATITSIIMPDKNGNKENVVLGYATLDEYLNDPFYIGCTVGRVANRIANGRFSIDNIIYQLAINEPSNKCHLHGGTVGFNKKVFDVTEEIKTDDAISISMKYVSDDMEEGYPGKVSLVVTFTLNNSNELLIDYKAVTNKATHINLTNHSYFNLSGNDGEGKNQSLYINADKYLEADKHYIPTGKYIDVEGSKHDFRKVRAVNQFGNDLMYNECFVLNKPDMNTCAAELHDEQSKRSIKVYTTFPGVMFYSGDGLNGTFKPGEGICLETQFFPDAANHPEFASTLLLPGENYNHQTKFVFSNNNHR